MKITKKLITTNFERGRAAPIDMITLHATEGDRASVISWFNDPSANVSAHYMVQKDGAIIQFVEEADTAWHNGRVNAPTAPLVLARPGVNPNRYSIGIEHENSGHEGLTDAQRAASAALIADIATRYRIPLDATHVVGHHAVYALKACPGQIDVGDMIRRAAALVAPVRPPKPEVVWSGFFGDWLVVTDARSDTDWRFVPMKEVRASVRPTVAQTALSAMPR